MSIPGRANWRKFRDKHKVPKGAVKSVSVGKLLENYEKVEDKGDLKKTLAVAKKSIKSLEIYHKAILKNDKLKSFAPEFESYLIEPLRNDIKSLTVLAAPGEALEGNLKQVIADGRSLHGDISKSDYEEYFLSDGVRLVSMNGARIAKIKPEFKTPLGDYLKVLRKLDMNQMEGKTEKEFGQAAKLIMVTAATLYKAAKEQGVF